MINVGPTKEGHIDPIYQERLIQLGEWLSLNGEAIYESNPWVEHQSDTLTTDVWYTQKDGATYASVLSWPENNLLRLGAVSEIFNESTEVIILDSYQVLEWSKAEDGVVSIQFPDKATVYRNDVWVLRFK